MPPGPSIVLDLLPTMAGVLLLGSNALVAGSPPPAAAALRDVSARLVLGEPDGLGRAPDAARSGASAPRLRVHVVEFAQAMNDSVVRAADEHPAVAHDVLLGEPLPPPGPSDERESTSRGQRDSAPPEVLRVDQSLTPPL